MVLPPLGLAGARTLARRMKAAAVERPGAPIVVHLFSGGGYIFVGWLYAHLAAAAAAGDAPAAAALSRTRALILDSSPASVNADVSSQALMAALLGEPAEGVAARHPRSVAAVRAVVQAYLRLPPLARQLAEVERSWRSDVPVCERLCLYSDADALVPAQVVEDFMQQQAARGCEVRRHKWSGSGHVEHYKQHPSAYAAECDALLQRLASDAAAATEGGKAGGAAGDAASTAAAGGAARAAAAGDAASTVAAGGAARAA